MRIATTLCVLLLTAAAAGQQQHDAIEPTRITLKLQDVPPQQALEQLARQAGLKIRTASDKLWEHEGVAKTISLDLDNVPFGRALIVACAEAGVLPGGDSQDPRTLVLRHEGPPVLPNFPGRPPPPDLEPLVPQAAWTRSPVIEGELVTVVLQSVGVRRTRTFHPSARPAPPSAASLNLSYHVIIDPKLQVYGLVSPQPIEVFDTDGRRIAPVSDEGTVSPLLDPNSHVNALGVVTSSTSGVGLATSDPERIGRLRFNLRMMAVTQTAAIEVPRILDTDPVEQELAGLRVRVERAQDQGNGHVVPVTIFSDQKTHAHWQQLRQRFQEPRLYRLLDHKGQPLTTQQVSFPSSRQPEELKLTVQFDRRPDETGRLPGLPETFVIELPLHVREMRFPIEFEDLPLP